MISFSLILALFLPAITHGQDAALLATIHTSDVPAYLSPGWKVPHP